MPRKKKGDVDAAPSKDAQGVRERGAEAVRREAASRTLKRFLDLPRLKMVDPPCHFRHGSPESALKREERSRKFIEQAKKKEAKVKAANAVKRAELRTRREIAKNLFAKELLSVEVVAECVGLPIDSMKRLARETRRRKRDGGDV